MLSWALFLFMYGCGRPAAPPVNDAFTSISSIPPPAGYIREQLPDKSFGKWLRDRQLKKENVVRLFNGKPKSRQNGHYVVLNIKTGSRDLQQCADAVIRLRAEYLLANGRVDEISFLSTSMQSLRFADWCKGRRYRLKGEKLEFYETGQTVKADTLQLDKWLEFVFMYAGTYSLQKQLKPKTPGEPVRPGDVIVEGGFPGHAMIVMDVCKNDRNENYFMLAQSYMPAQDMHVVLNPEEESSPWYNTKPGEILHTPDWSFGKMKLYEW